jgi:hypothetical protein
MRQRYIDRVRREARDLVPERETFTRSEVLALYVQARAKGYQRGYSAALMRRRRSVA